MSISQETTWEIDPHTQAKHEILRRYLGAWFPILLSKRHNRVVYIDGFSGPGRYKKGEPGSPIVALREAMKHSSNLQGKNLTFIFVERQPNRIKQLESELANLSIPTNFRVSVVAGEFASEFRALLDNLEGWGLQLAPTFAFIDPFGFKGLPFELVNCLLQNPQTEVFINLMVDSINRFLEHPDEQNRQHIVDLFGTTEVLEVAQRSGDRITELRLLYQQQLEKCAKFVRFFEMKNAHDRTIYYLFFATNHPLGHKKMKEAFWQIDSTSGFCFSDATNPHQPVLLEYDVSPTLAREIHRSFLGQRVPVSQIETFVDDQTPFLGTQMRSALKLLEQDKKIKVEEYKQDGKRRRKNSFPENAIVEFVQTLF